MQSKVVRKRRFQGICAEFTLHNNLRKTVGISVPNREKHII